MPADEEYTAIAMKGRANAYSPSCSRRCGLAPRLQVKGTHIFDYISHAERVAILDSVAPAMIAEMSDPVEYPSASRYLLAPAIGDVTRPTVFLLRAKYHRKWIDAFFARKHAGAHRIEEVRQPTLNWLALEESSMTIAFAYEVNEWDAPD
jgi:hypothetical protein